VFKNFSIFIIGFCFSVNFTTLAYKFFIFTVHIISLDLDERLLFKNPGFVCNSQNSSRIKISLTLSDVNSEKILRTDGVQKLAFRLFMFSHGPVFYMLNIFGLINFVDSCLYSL
jgi:hypothetical protein